MKSTVILVSWNSQEHCATCLDSLAGQNLSRNQFEVIMVDNGSSDNSVEFVRENYPWVRVFHHSPNNYAGANNLGIKKAKGEYIALLNVDTRLHPNWLPELMRTLDEHPRVGVVTSKIYEQAPQLYAVGMREIEELDWEPIGYHEEDDGSYDGVYPVDFINHCAALYRRKCLNAVGSLDEDFMMYHEDVDMSIRIRRGGWGLMVNTGSIAHHAKHGSISKRKHLFNYYIDRNRLYVIAKHYPGLFAQHFPRSRFVKYCYQDDSNDSFQADLSLMLDKWLIVREHSPSLANEFALLLRTMKEHNLDRLARVELDLKLKSEGLFKAVCQLEMDFKQLRREMAKLKKEGKNDYGWNSGP